MDQRIEAAHKQMVMLVAPSAEGITGAHDVKCRGVMLRGGEYRGQVRFRRLYLVGNKAINRITYIQVVTPDGNSVPLPLHKYVATQPWLEDIKIGRKADAR